MSTTPLTEQDLQIRLFIYRFLVDQTRPPSIMETALHFAIPVEEAKAAYHRLNDSHLIFLEPGTENVRMASPFSGVPTDYRVYVNDRWLWANCAWDTLGIPAALHADALCEATIRPSGERVTYRVVNGQLEAEDGLGLVHFLLPFSRWYENLVFT